MVQRQGSRSDVMAAEGWGALRRIKERTLRPSVRGQARRRIGHEGQYSSARQHAHRLLVHSRPRDLNAQAHSKGGFRTKRAAQEHLNEVLGKVQAGAWTPDKKITVDELLTEWLAAKKSQGLWATTIAQYQNVVDSWLVPHVGVVQLAKMSPAQAQQLVEVLRSEGTRSGGALSSRSVQLSVTLLKAATAWALETGLVGRDPLAGYRRPRAETRRRSLDSRRGPCIPRLGSR
jgi:hypothetical protein